MSIFNESHFYTCASALALCLSTAAVTPAAAQTFGYTGAIQSWSAPKSGLYVVTAIGAQGAAADTAYAGGRGAQMTGAFIFNQGQTFQYAVGGAGRQDGCNGGGGGGTFFVSAANNPLLVAGGGGGTRRDVLQNGTDGSTTPFGTTASLGARTYTPTVKTTELGLGGIVSAGSWGSGGAGFFGNGASDRGAFAGGFSWANGIGGGIGSAAGGFGGGGAGNGSCGGGGGGGYSGGDGGRVAGGGGSFDAGIALGAMAGVGYGSGELIIAKVNSPEVGANAERGVFQMTTQFLQLMLDPAVHSGGGAGMGGGGVMGFAPERSDLPPEVAQAYASVLKAPPSERVQLGWSGWAASFGGVMNSSGSTVTGANAMGANDYGFAAGMDYHFTPWTLAGFALAGGGTNWSVAQGVGSGRSDAFQAGVYGSTRSGPIYLGGSLAFANHWMSTSSSVMNDQISGRFNAQSYGGRVEAGYRYAVLPTLVLSPYAAAQVQSFHSPTYTETDSQGVGLGLTYASKTSTDTRGEIGARFDSPTMLPTAFGNLPLIMRGRVAWAHDWVSDPSVTAGFQTLPATGFVINGAPLPHDSALVTLGGDLFVTKQWTLMTKFYGEFAGSAQTYSGSVAARFTW